MIGLKLLDGSTLHDVRDNDRQVVGYISDAKNAVGTLDFDIYPKHPAYNDIKAGSTKIRAYRDGLWLHDYTVESVTNDLQLKKHVTATDELQYLERIEVPSYKTGVDGVPQTVSGLFMWLIEYYNVRSGGERFAFGHIEGDIIDPTTTLDRSSDSPATVASIVKDKIIDSLGGYVRVRRDNGVLTIDLKADAAGVCHQYIEFGENLVDYADEQDASELYTAITAESTYKDDNGDEVTITLADAPDGDYLTGYVKQGDTVTNTAAATTYGVRRKHLSFDGIESVYTLVENCEKYIAAHCEPVTTVNVSAADLSTLDSNVQSFDVGLYTRVKAAPMGFDAAFECQGAKRSLNDPTDDTYTLGWTWGSLSSINNRKSVETALGIGRLEQASAEIDQTAKDAAQQAQTAQDVANAANINAIDAVTKADSAAAEATSASDTAQRAEAISAEAKQTATQANGVAQDASETASTAAITAAQAGATASEAQKRADAAKTAAESAAAEAIDAKAAAADADAKATLAQTSATEAKSAADAANEAAGASGAAANAAQEAAGAAQATADAAATKAGQVAAETAAVERELAGVKQDALDLGADLNGKIDSVTSTMTADYAKKTELSTTEASLKSEITKSAAEIQQTVSETYAKTTDVEGNIATAKADLQTQITQNAGLISSTATAVESAQVDATAAQAKANSASTAAEAAQSTANTAKSNAATAQSTANTAKTNAATAQSAANKAQADATAAATAASAASTAAERAKADAIAAAGAYADSVAETLQGQIDGAIETWSGTVAPTATNAPAKDWTTTESKAKHVGDLYYDTATGYAYRYSTTYIWTLIKDTDVTKAIADAAAAQSAADAAKASASTAQSTANTAKTNAATAQTAANNANSTANTAKTNAANAQASADAAQAAADGAQADVDALGTRVTTAETAITQSAEQIALKANKTDVYAKGDTYSKTQADAAIKVSADSITSTVSETYATQTSLATTDTKATNAASAASTAQSTANTAKTNAATAQSTADTAKANASTAQTGVNGLTTRMTAAESSITQQADSIALRATKTEVATAKSEAVSAAATDATTKANNAKSAAVSAAASDATTKANDALAGAKTYADAQIKVQADRITANVSDTDALGTRMSTVEQTSSGLTVRLGTAEGNITTAQNTANTAKSNAATAQSTADTANSTANTAKTNAATAQTTANTARTEAAAAAKTASNYMEYTSAGLDVGNKSSGAWSGLRSRMASGAFQVLNSAGTVLSSFGADLIEIGKNSINSVIKLCGGKGSIAYYADTDQLAIMAPGSIAMTACQTLPDGTVQPYDAGIACNQYGVLAKGAVEVSGTLSINNKPVVDYVTSRSASGNLVTETYASGKKMISTSSPISFASGLGRVAVSNNVVSVYIASYGSMNVTGSGVTFAGVIPAILIPPVNVVSAGTALGNALAQITVDETGSVKVWNFGNSPYWAGSLSYIVNP